MTRQNATRPIRDADAPLIDLTPPDRRVPTVWRVLALALLIALAALLVGRFAAYVTAKAAHDAAWAVEWERQ